jgi:diguanylate cyclase (GGDEF)-like protein
LLKINSLFSENIEDVYCRVFSLLDSLDIKQFALYEIDNNKNKMLHVKTEHCEGISDESPMPCAQDILVNADACRAKRLAQVITGDAEYKVCPKYNCYSEGKKHMCIPIIIGGTAGEIVHVTMDETDADLVKSNLPLLEEYLKNAAPVIESKKLLQNLRETTLTDALTGLNNRRFLEEYIEVLMAEAQRKGNQVGILMCDLDYFKKVNDVHGHEVGDKVLKMLSQIMKDSVRSSDIVIRYGGEEFLIIIKDAEDDDAVVNVAEKIRQNVQAYEMRVGANVNLKKTISLGVSLFPRDTENFWQAIKFADVSLYKAKETGRNKVVRFDVSMWTDDSDY